MNMHPLSKVVLKESVNRPLNKKGVSPGNERVFEREPGKARDLRNDAQGYDLWFCDGFVIIEDRDSHAQEWVPVHNLQQMRKLVEAPAAKAKP